MTISNINKRYLKCNSNLYTLDEHFKEVKDKLYENYLHISLNTTAEKKNRERDENKRDFLLRN